MKVYMPQIIQIPTDGALNFSIYKIFFPAEMVVLYNSQEFWKLLILQREMWFENVISSHTIKRD